MSEISDCYPLTSIMLRTLIRAPTQTWKKQLIYPSLLNSSIIRTAGSSENPQNLPKLPVPRLKDTLEKYIRSLKPLLSLCEYRTSCEIATEFACSDTGTALQEYILKRAKCKTNWLEEWWLNAAYLGFRNSVVVYSSPAQSIPLETFNYEDDRVIYTARLISAAVSYKMIIDSKKMPVDKLGKYPLDMAQYDKIFGTCRIPCSPLDILQFNPKSNYIIVMHKNHFFKMKVFFDGKPFNEQQLIENLKCILSQSCDPEVPIGVLTSDHRDNWTTYYQDLVEGNESVLADIQQSLFLICLDDAMPCNTIYANKQTKCTHQVIHGGGSCANSGNRWFDKTIQFVIGVDGCVGITYEHSPSEGQPIAYMVDYLYNYIKSNGGKNIPRNCPNDVPKKLCFTISQATQANIQKAKINVDRLVANFQLDCFKFDSYGKNFIKKYKFSPDSYIQMAMQYAYYKMYECVCAHYESAATRKFIGGRTETIRSCSVESLEFAKAMTDKCLPSKDKLAAMKSAIQGHKNYTLQAIEGLGVDRHLLGLKIAAQELGCDTPAIFCDLGYTKSTDFRITSSQVATKCDAVMGYGPTSPEGYGICYNPRDNDMNFALSCFVDGSSTNVETFKNCFIEALCEMEDLILKVCKEDKPKESNDSNKPEKSKL